MESLGNDCIFSEKDLTTYSKNLKIIAFYKKNLSSTYVLVQYW